MSGLKRNFLYQSILTVSNYIFPILTYPYVSRVLGVDKIGYCNYIDSIINYFILFSMLGFGAVGIREVAKNKNNRLELNKTFSNILFFNTITTFTVSLFFIVINKITLHIPDVFFLIGIIKIFSTSFQIEWLYIGLENFKIITQRTLIVKILYVISVFLFIKDSSDYTIYFFLLCFLVFGNALVNLLYAHKYVSFTLHNIEIKKYIKPVLSMGGYMILTSMYTSFNVVYLGYVTNETEVGYYTTATKLYSIIIALFSAFTSVMLPRMSSLLAENNTSEFRTYIIKSINILIILSVPLIIYTILYAPHIILILSGKGYEGAILPMRIVMPLVLIIGYLQILVIQILIPLKKDSIVLINSLIGALVGVSCNILLVNTYKSIGSAWVWLISEFSTLFVAQYYVTKYINIKFPLPLLIHKVMLHIPLAIILYIIYILISSPFLAIAISGIVLIIYEIVLNLYIDKEAIVIALLKRIPIFRNHK